MSAGLERRLVRKVVGYVVRDRRILVFTHDDVPLAIGGVQVLAGTIEASEPHEAAVVREVLEETGVNARIVDSLGIERYDVWPSKPEVHARHFFQLEPLKRSWAGRDCARKARDHRGYGDPSGALLRHIRGVLDEPAVALRASVGASRAEGHGRCYYAAAGRVTGHLIVVSGLPGVGKTSVAAVVAARTRSVHLSIDAVEETILAARAVAGG